MSIQPSETFVSLYGIGEDSKRVAMNSTLDFNIDSGHESVPDLVGTVKPFSLAESTCIDAARLVTMLYDSIHTGDRLQEAMRKGRSLASETSWFLPTSSLRRLITAERVKSMLRRTGDHVDNRFSEVVATDPWKILAVLLILSNRLAMPDFTAHGVDDNCLPISHSRRYDTAATPHGQFNSSRPRSLAPGEWTTHSFVEWQHTMQQLRMDVAHPVALDRGFPGPKFLPFTHVEQWNSGGYGTIFRVRMHPGHDYGPRPVQELQRGSRFLAVKKLRNRNDRDFLRELSALQRVSLERHPNIVPFIGSFKHGLDFHFVFPWADGDLSTFWRLNPAPEMNTTRTESILGHCIAVAEGLAAIHSSQITHYDLKPANILWFREGEPGHERDVFKITDFGSARFNRVRDRHTVEPDEIPPTTRVYRAPECDLEPRNISPAVDIWCMGCIFLEFCTWMLSGSAGLAELASRRQDTSTNNSTGDAFFHYPQNSVGSREIRLKPKIVEWASAIASVSDFWADLMQLIQRDMLVFRKEDHMFGRLDSKGLSEALSTMRQSIKRNPTYCEPRGSLDIMMVHSSRPVGAPPNRKRSSATVVSLPTENEAKRKRTSKTNTGGVSSNLVVSKEKFACPFWKAGMDKMFLNRACGGPGWDEVHRVKEHIKRCHTPSSFKAPHVCGRCLGNFGSQEQLMKHHREDSQCIIRAPEIIHGKITLEQVINLRSTKKKAADMTDEEKWFEWFSILLPTHPPPSSPYYEDTTSSTLDTLSTQNSTGIYDYKEYLRIPLNDEKQKALEVDLGEALGISNPDMCKILAAKFRDYQLRDLQKFDEDKSKTTYELPDLSDLRVLGKEHDTVSDIGNGASAEFDSLFWAPIEFD